MARVLIVDKEAQIRKLLKTILVGTGYQVLTAHDPQAAIEIFNSMEELAFCAGRKPSNLSWIASSLWSRSHTASCKQVAETNSSLVGRTLMFLAFDSLLEPR